MTISGNPEITLYNNPLPKGCELCRLGSKLVVFISGECGDSCYYCPVSSERFNKDKMFANEMEVKDLMDYIYESYRMNALGAGITGGDPILALDKVTELIGMFKEEFGESFHIHLYTSGRYVTNDVLKELVGVGLDEIRFHPLKEEYKEAIRKALKYDLDVGIEIPSIPGEGERTVELVKWAKKEGVKFVNLNELELNERNFFQLNSRGMKVAHGITGAKGSYENARKVVEEFREDKEITVHYCSSVYKDVVETRTRFLRTIRFSSKAYEGFTGEGTVVRAILKGKVDDLTYGEKIGNDLYSFYPEVIDELVSKYDVSEVKIVEEHPDSRRLKVSERLIYSKSQQAGYSS
ncbi:radical SAM protein [Sulfuracidifex tepidarius]|uniref:7-carboxy-7-deazaguanine synthase n=1 Tax=Sulfuracidifex tepidarius TaxID=1294262 RepID=A0A510DWQ2_9CREN|nr:radical SAM protein [Sulfuracidifex tepidarius]BBG24627.1 7-carboxy-7-deazaguanine synthase [Sulfuracidifex tepidarius]BBG27415.1 7-carboxy-7-deazaguanine synthase [Sulfuracidifex tepidarius]